MAGNVVISGYPPVVRMSFIQGSGADPGRFVVDTLVVGPENLTTVPRIATINIYARNFAGTWNDCRLVRAVRVRNGYMRCVFDDDRWKLRETQFKENYNDRDTLGKVLTGNKKTLSELCDVIAATTGLSVSVGEDCGFEPPAKWLGRQGDECVADLLKYSGCRMVYNPLTAEYKITLAGSGPLPDLTPRIFRPGPDPKIGTLQVITSPVLYEDELDVKAIQINKDTGDVEDLTATTLPDSPTEDYGQIAFRLWGLDGDPPAGDEADAILLDHRAKAHLFDPESPMHERARFVRDEFVRTPCHSPLYVPGQEPVRLVELTGGGRAFLTDHPIMMTDGTGALLKEGKIVTSYYMREGETLKTNMEEVTIPGPGSDTLKFYVKWIKPVESSIDDMTGAVWDTLLTDVATAISSRYKVIPQTIRFSNPIDLGGSGQVGAVQYTFNTTQNRASIYFQVAFNFAPGGKGYIR